MYINISNLLKLPNPLMLPFLLLLKQVPKKDLTEELARLIVDDDSLNILIEEEYVKIIKGKKDADFISLLRLGKKGTAYLHSLEEAEVLDEDKKIFDWLAEIYKKNDKQIGNGKRTQRHIASFREKTGIEKNKLAFLCDTFIKDDSEMEWSFKLEYVFFKPTNAFQTRFVLEDSRLFKYHTKRKEFFENKFKNIK